MAHKPAPSIFQAPAFRVLFGFGVLGTIALVASVFGPRFSAATPATPARPVGGSGGPVAASIEARPLTPAKPTPPITDSAGHPLLGSLVGGPYGVWIYSSPDGPLYTVVSQSGKVLREGMNVDEVYRAFPDLPIDRMRLMPAGDGTKLMLADPSGD